MAVALADKAVEMLEDMPHYYADDPAATAVIDPVARELERLEAYLTDLRSEGFPQNADDSPRLLGLWELMLGLPVEPAGMTPTTRRAKVMAALRRRYAGAGAGWAAVVSEAIGTSAWTHEENVPEDYVLSVNVPVDSTGFTAGQIEQLLESVTPAHLDITLTFGGFQVGVSRVGDQI